MMKIYVLMALAPALLTAPKVAAVAAPQRITVAATPALVRTTRAPAARTSGANKARDTTARAQDAALLDDIQRRAVLFFHEKSDAHTGLAHDRARLDGSDTYDIASMAATGYALAALPIAVERGWVGREQGAAQARRTLNFVLQMPHERGWMFHFVDARSGERAWNSEVSTIDTALFALGALACGEYFRAQHPDIAHDAGQFYERLDWNWARTNGGSQPEKQVLAHGWKPEQKVRGGFLRYNYDSYSEAILLVLLGLGAPRNPLPASAWDALARPVQSYEGVESLSSGPIFIHQMPHGFLPLRHRRDRLGWDYWASSSGAMRIHQLFGQNSKRKTHARGFWALNASDGPRGYTAYGAPGGPEDGTVSPSGAIASIAFDRAGAIAIARKMKGELGHKIWGRYGFSDAFNLDKNWFDADVIGIDLGMALLAIENKRSGLIWKLMQRQPWLSRAYEKAGLRVTREAGLRALKK